MMPSGPIKLNADQIAKLQSELDVVQGNMRVFDEMLGELTPGKEHNDDWALLTELQSTLEAMQKRIVELIEKVANEDITIELLRINDELNNMFVRYERFVKKKSTSNQAKAAQPAKASAGAEASPLIDLGDELGDNAAASSADIDTDALVSRINSMALANKQAAAVTATAIATSTATATATATAAGGDDFDAFAQSRSTANEAPKPSTDSTV